MKPPIAWAVCCSPLVRQGSPPHPPHGSRSHSFTVLSSLTDAIVWPFLVIAREYTSPLCALNANTTSPVFTLYRPIVAFLPEDCEIRRCFPTAATNFPS